MTSHGKNAWLSRGGLRLGKKEKKQYVDKLAEPLPPLPTLLDEDHEERAKVHYEALAERIGLLFEHHGVDRSDEDAWMKLALELAAAHVPGFQYVDSRTDQGRLVDIVFNVEYLVRKHGIAREQAFRELAKAAPSLGTSEAIRSVYRETTKRAAQKSLHEFLARVSSERGEAFLLDALEGSVLPGVRALRDIAPAKPGRPRKE